MLRAVLLRLGTWRRRTPRRRIASAHFVIGRRLRLPVPANECSTGTDSCGSARPGLSRKAPKRWEEMCVLNVRYMSIVRNRT